MDVFECDGVFGAGTEELDFRLSCSTDSIDLTFIIGLEFGACKDGIQIFAGRCVLCESVFDGGEGSFLIAERSR